MAETRLPDVVPAKDLATVKETGELLSGVVSQGHSCDSELSDVHAVDWHISIVNQDNPGDPPIVQIWPDNTSPDSPLTTHPPEEDSHLDPIEHRSCSQLSDSGIDSQLASPTVTDGYNKLQEQSSFVLDLSATHLSVPSLLRPGCIQQSSLDSKQQPLKEDEKSAVENSIIHRSGDPSAPTIPSSSGFLPQKRSD